MQSFGHCDIRTVQELMRRKDLKMTVRYSHLAPKHTRPPYNSFLGQLQRLRLTPKLALSRKCKFSRKRNTCSKSFQGKMLALCAGP